MKIKLSASIMCANFSHLERDIRILEEEGVDYLHFDIMDGHFVPNFTMGPDILASLKKITDLPFDTHLMIEDPDRYIPIFIEAGSTFISIHVETCPHLDRTIRLIKKKGARVRVALNPATPLCRLDYILEEISSVLVMTVNPGFASQKLVPSTISKIKKLKEIIEKRALEVDIAVDGNVSFTHAPSMVKAGANVLVCGSSSIFHPEFGIKEGIAKLRKTLDFSLSHHC